jgi:phage-related protein
MPFNDLLRGYPFIWRAVTNVLIANFEDGSEQRRDVWGGKIKNEFTISFNVNNKTEILAVKSFFDGQKGPANSFSFTNPITGTTHTVRFVENSLVIERRYYDTYYATVRVQEVF